MMWNSLRSGDGVLWCGGVKNNVKKKIFFPVSCSLFSFPLSFPLLLPPPLLFFFFFSFSFSIFNLFFTPFYFFTFFCFFLFFFPFPPYFYHLFRSPLLPSFAIVVSLAPQYLFTPRHLFICEFPDLLVGSQSPLPISVCH